MGIRGLVQVSRAQGQGQEARTQDQTPTANYAFFQWIQTKIFPVVNAARRLLKHVRSNLGLLPSVELFERGSSLTNMGTRIPHLTGEKVKNNS